jgi:sugar phosphate permease
LTFIPTRPDQKLFGASRLHYAWIITAVTFVVMLLTAGVRTAPGILIVPLEGEFHWSRSTISLAVGINLLVYGAVGPFAAAIMDRFGVRRTMSLALAATGIGVALTPTMTQSWQLLLLWGVVVGLGTGFLGWYLSAYIATRWFRARQGVVMGVLIAASAAGQLVFLPAMAWVTTDAGWRSMSLMLAAVVIGFVPMLAWLMRDRPEDVGLLPYGGTREDRPATPAGNPAAVAFRALADGARSRDFWLLAGSYFVCGASTNGLISTHLIPACIDHGLSEVAGAGLLATTGVFAFIGGTASGWLSDRWDNRFLLFWYFGLRGLSLMYLPFALDLSLSGLSLFAVFYGLDWIATGPPTARLMSGVVGNERTGMMIAWINVIHQVGGAGAAYLGGLSRISFGSYLEAFMFSGVLCIGAALMVLFIGSQRRPQEPAGVPMPVG